MTLKEAYTEAFKRASVPDHVLEKHMLGKEIKYPGIGKKKIPPGKEERTIACILQLVVAVNDLSKREFKELTDEINSEWEEENRNN